jgi:bacterioferritin-associated ferredoxin
MEIIQLCPECGFPAIPVNEKAVRFNLVDSIKPMIKPDLKWSICSNPQCDCSYFSKKQLFKTTDLIKPLFYKDSNDDVPVCYCSELTRGEIKDAVKNGKKTIDEVQAFTKKNITGYCEEHNPLGKCCRNVFLRTIAEASDNNTRS